MKKQKEKNAPVILKYRDSVFRLLFKDKTKLLSLFNAINGTDYKDAEVIQMSLFEYDEEAHMKSIRRQAQEDVIELYSKLLADDRLDDLRHSIEDSEYRRQLMVEYGIEDELEDFAITNL